MDSSWTVHGQSTECPWTVHGLSMDLTHGSDPWIGSMDLIHVSDFFCAILRSFWDHSLILKEAFGVMLGSLAVIGGWKMYEKQNRFLSRNWSGDALEPTFPYQSMRLGQGTSKTEVLTIFLIFCGKLGFYVFGFSRLSVSSQLPV